MSALLKTAPFEFGDGEDACLLLHGFTGSPWEVRPLADALAAKGFHCKGIRLPGHGLSPEAMTTVDHRDWLSAADEGLRSLKAYRRVYVAGLSMGALLAMLLGARHKSRVAGLALMAPATGFQDRTLRLVKALGLGTALELFKPFVVKRGSDIQDPRARADNPLLPRYPSARFRDLWALQALVQREVPFIEAPCLVAVARHDHVVERHAGVKLSRQLTSSRAVRFIELQEGFHIMPRDTAGPLLAAEVVSFFSRHR